MQFIDLKAQQKRIHARLMENISTVLTHGQYILGPEIKELEKRLGDYTGVRHAVSCASGTDALLMALMAYGVGPGDAVFTTPFTFVATAEVISLLGATPVFVDIESDTFNMDPGCLEQAITALKESDPELYPLPGGYMTLTAKGVIPVDLFGQCADYGRINTIAKEHGLFVIEDAAQSFGAEYDGAKACSLAHVAATSFFPAKPLGCYGDGGMVFTDDDELAVRLDSIRVHGKGSDKYDNIRIGINGRCDTLQAAVLLAKFEIFPEEISLRQEAALRYETLLGSIGGLACPVVRPGNLSAWAQYSVLCTKRDLVLDALKEAKIPTAVYYPKPLHVQGAYAYLGYAADDFPVSMQSASEIFSLPMHPYLAEQDQAMIADVIRKAYK
ncbi:MAG TPA: DegT/DnrJ/EryC1/StrS family aminotransferase [Deltaproteobacteria bacterium]|nr:DegT/DnrJ/EryC1/StrS family aminotransferase [Deltaproteobacteria bacterium]HXK47572.1 DegT/DnrJ/EryC1/StrS family aminotransferase [Deltaproteobacteria bacterium]